MKLLSDKCHKTFLWLVNIGPGNGLVRSVLWRHIALLDDYELIDTETKMLGFFATFSRLDAANVKLTIPNVAIVNPSPLDKMAVISYTTS